MTRAGLDAPRIVGRQGSAPPVYTYTPAPGVPPVGVLRLDRASLAPVEPPGTHAHDFPGLTFFERGGGSLRSGEREWRVQAGDLYVVAPGEMVGVGGVPGFERARGWAVYFTPEAVGLDAPGAFLSWHTHPLLSPFARGMGRGLLRLKVPASERRSWSARCSILYDELAERRDGYQDAAIAHLTLLLVSASRLAADVVGDLRLNDEPLLAEVFDFIERHHAERISLKDVAAAVHLSPGHLTTLIRRRTGRTVQQWITERRMVAARRLLAETDLPVEEVGRRAGYADAVYFVRSFRAMHAITPLRWRRAGRGPAA